METLFPSILINVILSVTSCWLEIPDIANHTRYFSLVWISKAIRIIGASSGTKGAIPGSLRGCQSTPKGSSEVAVGAGWGLFHDSLDDLWPEFAKRPRKGGFTGPSRVHTTQIQVTVRTPLPSSCDLRLPNYFPIVDHESPRRAMFTGSECSPHQSAN